MHGPDLFPTIDAIYTHRATRQQRTSADASQRPARNLRPNDRRPCCDTRCCAPTAYTALDLATATKAKPRQGTFNARRHRCTSRSGFAASASRSHAQRHRIPSQRANDAAHHTACVRAHRFAARLQGSARDEMSAQGTRCATPRRRLGSWWSPRSSKSVKPSISAWQVRFLSASANHHHRDPTRDAR